MKYAEGGVLQPGTKAFVPENTGYVLTPEQAEFLASSLEVCGAKHTKPGVLCDKDTGHEGFHSGLDTSGKTRLYWNSRIRGDMAAPNPARMEKK